MRLRLSLFSPLALCGFLLVSSLCSPRMAVAQAPQQEFGPYQVNVLRDGPALLKPLSDQISASNRTADLLDGNGHWSLAFWFHADEPLSGKFLIAGFGDPAQVDARYIGIDKGHLALWLGTGINGGRLLQADKSTPALKPGWHFAAAVGSESKILIFLDGLQTLELKAPQGSILPQLWFAPYPNQSLGTSHFGGKIAGLQLFASALNSEQILSLSKNPPDYEHATYEEASKLWHIQAAAVAPGLPIPQEPSSLPHAKAAPQMPVAKPLTERETKTRLEGSNGSWKILGGWHLIAEPETSANAEQISRPGFADKNWYVATVPGTVLTTLIDRGVYPDPDYGLNNLAIPESLAHQDYWYRVEFPRPSSPANQRLLLGFDGVNYAAEIWLNGHKLGTIKGAFKRGQYDVTQLVKNENALAVHISPPPHPGIAHEQSIKAGPGDNGGIQMIDGPTFEATEGWDWIPGIRDRNSGIWQDVTLTAVGPVELGDANVITTLPKADLSLADLEIEVPLINAQSTPIDGTLTAAFDDVRIEKKLTLAPGENIIRLKPADFAALHVANPKLWWPNGYGEPTLHDLSLNFSVNGATSSQKKLKFGMRELSYETSLFDSNGHLRRLEVLPARTHDEAAPLLDERHEGIRRIDDWSPNLTKPGEQLPDYLKQSWVHSLVPGAENTASIRDVPSGWPSTDLVVKVNGVRIAARGGNWGTDDSRKRVSIDHLEPYFRLHRDAHVNMIRNWMGQNIEENFYELADKYGLMVWNDFWESTQDDNMEAADPQLFLDNARDAIVHYRHHPSIVVWCGRNEGVPQPILNEGMAQLVRTLDHTRYYTGSSNQVNLRNSGPYQFQNLDTYYRINRGFSVELGIPSVPTLEAIKSFIPKQDLWPISDTWAYHDWHISGNGAVAPFIAHLETEFGAATGLEDFERKAQMLDYVGHRAIFEGMAAHLWEPNSGRMIWMTQPAWPSMEWNFLGSDYDTQSSFYGSMKALEPVHAQLNLDDNNVDLIVLGTQTAAADYSVRLRVLSLDGKSISDKTETVHAAPNARTSVAKPDLKSLAAGHTVLVKLDVADAKGAPISDNLYWWSADEGSLRELTTLAPVALEAHAHSAADGSETRTTVTLKNNTATPALLVKLTLRDKKTGDRILPAYYSDNYLSLLPGEQKTITVNAPTFSSPAELGLRGWNLVEGAIAIQ